MARSVLVYGGAGQLGANTVKKFLTEQWWVCSADVRENSEASANIVINPGDDLQKQADFVLTKLAEILGGKKLDSIVCVAGGWAGGNTASEDFLRNCDIMLKQCVWTSVISARAASLHLGEGGLLQLTGAKPALESTPGMIGYGLSKAAIHQMVESLRSRRSGLPKDACVVGLLPITLDTAQNRAAMPDAKHADWTPLDTVSHYLYQWSDSRDSRPASGSLIELSTKDSKTTLIMGELQKSQPLALM